MELEKYFIVAFISILPAIEIRGGILYGLSQGLNPLNVFLVAVAANFVAGMIVLFALNNLLPHFLKIGFLERFYDYSMLRARKNYQSYIEKYGAIGLALFIAVPLPGTGSWTGALAAFLMGMSYKKFAIVNLIGVIMAGIIVTLAGIGIIKLFF